MQVQMSNFMQHRNKQSSCLTNILEQPAVTSLNI